MLRTSLRSRSLLIVVAALLASAALLIIAFSGALPAAQKTLAGLSRQDSDVARLEARLALLEEKIDRISGYTSPQAGTATGRRGGVADSKLETSKSSEELRQSYRQQEEALATAFQTERTDPAWSSRAESELRQVASTDAILAIEAAPPTRQTIDCRSTQCRIEFEFSDSADADDWTIAFLTSVGGTLHKNKYFVSRNPDGSALVRLYGSR
jgi:hypothetical protein